MSRPRSISGRDGHRDGGRDHQYRLDRVLTINGTLNIVGVSGSGVTIQPDAAPAASFGGISIPSGGALKARDT